MYPEHPLAGSLEDLTIEQLQVKLSELWKKLSYARTTGNAYLVNQISMMITTYQTAYENKIRKDPDIPYTSVIDIS